MNKKFICTDKGPYAFISYSHADTAKVEHILSILHANGKRLWYDWGIKDGEEWEKEVNDHLQGSSMFILFVTNGIELRHEVKREFELAMKRHSEDKNYKVIAVMLERVPIKHLFKGYNTLIDYFKDVQYIQGYAYGGITRTFAEKILSDEVWESCMTAEERAEYKADPDGGHSLVKFSAVNGSNPYIYPLVYLKKSSKNKLKFYKVNVGETDPGAVYPICMDNQWTPPEFYDREDFKKDGFKSGDVQIQRIRMQRYEIYRALIHHRQVLINRASIYNTSAIADWYTKGSDDEKAFCNLIDNGSFVVYLYNEDSPVDLPGNFEVYKDNFNKWAEICASHPVYCIRFSWNDGANEFESSIKLSAKFEHLLIVTANHSHRLKQFADLMDISPDKKTRGKWKALWRNVRENAVAQDDMRSDFNDFKKEGDKTVKGYTRESFYRDFIIKDGSAVPDCVIDENKNFARELKRIVDFMYSVNLPMALHIRPVSSYETRLWSALLDEEKSRRQMRTISTDELMYCAASFEWDFLRNIPVYQPDSANELTLAAVEKVRHLEEWDAYMEAISAGQKRSNLNEVDFNDLYFVWEKYLLFMEACAKKLSAEGFDFTESAASVSIIYTFGATSLTCVYTQASNVIKVKPDNSDCLSKNALENLTIDYVCGDILASSLSDNCFLERIRLFEGVISESGKKAYEAVYNELERMETDGRFKIDWKEDEGKAVAV